MQTKAMATNAICPIGALANAIAGPLLLLDTSLTITTWNHHCEAMSGFSADDITGRPFYAVFPHAAANPKIGMALQQALRGYSSFLPDEECSYTDGHYDNHFAPLRNQDGIVTGILHQRYDIAHRIKAADELTALNDTLRKKNAALQEMTVAFDELCKATGQELYAPMRRVSNFINLLLNNENEQLTETGRRYFERIRSQVSKMDEVLSRLVDYVAVDNDDSQPEKIDPTMLFRMIRNSLHKEMLASGAALQWGVLPHITGRRTLLYQAFEELVRNAIKFRKTDIPPRIYISGSIVHLEPLSGDGVPQIARYASISISDNSSGCPAEETAAIFGLFYRGKNAAGMEGNGLGLALCRKIIELYGGYIQAMPREGGGCTITCCLPV